MRVRINLSKDGQIDMVQLSSLIKEHKATVSFFTSNNVEDDFLYEIEDSGFISRGKSQINLFEILGKNTEKQILKG